MLECKQFYLAGLLHDLGKLAIPSEILNKPYSLTKEEFDLIRQHPYYSHSILEHVEGFEKIAVWAGTHHETLDEKGYPYKLKGSDIDLGSHIIAVADVFSSLIEDRPYRKGMSLIEAFDIIEDMVKNLKLDVNVVKEAKKNQNAIFKLIKK
ncbi:putative domain HDIG-containing protein [Clostridium sartagoforme AAU1]|uniref:Putative domain HDIG-containing protein n=1 Tax=Clostridium sartagoforme AAU1 TaxID=1202534 RepID=R9CK27_9CLOT|nr:HD domain-containing phosphohydrolase [Clostridium sartagoforme]EOR27531.1 putative domain HDIG-containing protein [Clostridium sartagoforme AAU1]